MTSFVALLAERGLTRQDFIRLTGYSQRYTRYLVSGLEPVTPQVRAALARITPMTPPPPDTLPYKLARLVEAYDPAALTAVEAETLPDGTLGDWFVAVWIGGDILCLRSVDDWRRYLHSQGQSEKAATLDLEDAPVTPRQHGPNSGWRFIPAVQP